MYQETMRSLSINNIPNEQENMICVEKQTQMNTNVTSGKMYVNPKFLLNNIQRSVHGSSEQAVNFIAVKPSVYVNPKLVAQIMKTNLQNDKTAKDKAVSENSTVRKVQNIDTKFKKFIGRNYVVNSNKYTYCSKTKLIKQNLQHMDINIKKPSESFKKLVPKKTTPVGSAVGPLMTLSKTKLVRVRRSSSQSSKNLPSSPNNSSKMIAGRRPSFSSTMIRVGNTKLVRVPVKQRKNNVQEMSNSLSHTASNLPLISISKTKLVRSPIKQRRSVLSNKLLKHKLQNPSRSEFSSKQSEPRTVVSISRTKLIRSPVKARRSSTSENTVVRHRELSRSYAYPAVISSRARRCSVKTPNVAVKAAKSVCSKYKIIRSPVLRTNLSYSINKVFVPQKTRYKIDRRSHRMQKGLKNFKKYSLQLDDGRKSRDLNYKNPKYLLSPLKFQNRTWRKSISPRKVLITDKKLMRIGRSPIFGNKEETCHKQQNVCLVQIGGVLYKTSKMKLTRSSISKYKTQDFSKEDKNLKKQKLPGLVVSVRGNKFLMDPAGKRLIKVSQKQMVIEPKMHTPVKRIDIGGVTYVQKSKNVLIRTNTHTARTFVSQAKQKSIAMLTNKLRKSNQPCIFYHRFGKCTKKEKGRCPHIHDPNQVAICRKFLQGCCEMNCTLSHDVGPEKMPTCKYFLEGCCIREKCPYLHVKVNEKAAICEKFLQGYCPDGKKCRKRHSFLCPEFDKTGKCSKGKYCPYPHQSVVKKKRPVPKKSIEKVLEQNERKRYYEADEQNSVQCNLEENVVENSAVNVGSDMESKRLKLLKKINDMKSAWLNVQSNKEDDHPINSDMKTEGTYEPEIKRPKIGTLPSYIPLTSDLQ